MSRVPGFYQHFLVLELDRDSITSLAELHGYCVTGRWLHSYWPMTAQLPADVCSYWLPTTQLLVDYCPVISQLLDRYWPIAAQANDWTVTGRLQSLSARNREAGNPGTSSFWSLEEVVGGLAGHVGFSAPAPTKSCQIHQSSIEFNIWTSNST